MKRPDPEPGFDLAHARVAAAVAQRVELAAELDAWIASTSDERPRAVVVFVCPKCDRYWAKSEGKQQFYCRGVGHMRHAGTKGVARLFVEASA